MVEELENNEENNEAKQLKEKKKQKFIFAKDRKQGVLALVVGVLFVANSLYMVVKYVLEQRAQATAGRTTVTQEMILSPDGLHPVVEHLPIKNKKKT